MMKRYILHDETGNILGELQCPPSQLAANTPDGCASLEVDMDEGHIDQRRMKVIEGTLTRIEASKLEIDPNTARPLR